MDAHLGTDRSGARTPGMRRAALVSTVVLVILSVRQLSAFALQAAGPGWSSGATMFVETLVLAGAYAALAWYFVLVPARRRSSANASVRQLRVTSHTARTGSRGALERAAVAGSRPRHLTLVPNPHPRPHSRPHSG